MSILLSALAFIACVASAAGGAWAMRWHIERNRVVADTEDPRDSQIRDLQAQCRMARNDMDRNQQLAKDANDHVELAHNRIEELAARAGDVKDKLEEGGADLLKAHSSQDLMRDKLSVATQQLETLKQRNQELELELELNESDASEMLSPQAHTGEIDDDDDDDDDADDAHVFQSTVEDGSPSLLHSLTSELDKWKRHCHVLGDELKTQRDRVSDIHTSTMVGGIPLDAIDELTDIRGIGNVLARKLHKLGIYRYEDLLSMSADDIERARLLIPDFDRRMRRDEWLDQARELQQGRQHAVV